MGLILEKSSNVGSIALSPGVLNLRLLVTDLTS